MKRLGFFDRKEVESDEVKGGVFLTCESCGLSKKSTNPKLGVTGKGNKKILLLGEANSPTEDRTGRHWTGAGSEVLKKELDFNKIHIYDDCWSLNVVRCSHRKTLTKHQINCCSRFLEETILELKPKVIICFGRTPLQALFENQYSISGEFETWRGATIPSIKYDCFVCPTYPPLHMQDTKKQESLLAFKKDIANAVCLNKPALYNKEKIHYISDLNILRKVIKPGNTISIDFETTGLKPHTKGHRIICASVSPNVDEAYVFEIPTKSEELQPFLDILENPKIYKMAHNMKYEHTWAKVIWGIEIQGWIWDSMLSAHILDNRRGVVGLKFQAFTLLGSTDYSSDINQYIRTKDRDSNGFNNILTLIETDEGKKKLLKYCALDTIYQYRIAQIQQERMQGELLDAYKLFHNGILTLSQAEQIGMRLDLDVVKEAENYLENQINVYHKKLINSEFYASFKKINGAKANYDSNTQLADYLYNSLELKPFKTTTGGNGSVDDEALRNLNIQELNYILEIRRLTKAKDTYLKAFVREQVDTIIHPNFNLHNVVSFRSSSDSPNFQNLPKRDKEIFNLVRGCIFPRKGYQLAEVDFKGIEVSIACTYHKDKKMIEYLLDDSSDMHGDMAEQIFLIDKLDRSKSSHKTLRSASKNAFVFPQFYGDYYKNNALGLCQWMELSQGVWRDGQGIELEKGISIASHLRKNGIANFNQFTEHIRQIELDFWNNRFPAYGRWKKRIYNSYLRNGQVTSHTGFTYTAEMRKNEVTNYPVQGSAFHCLLWSVIRLNEIIKQKQWKTRIVGQIHDSIVLDIYPPELPQISRICKRIMTVELANNWQWINVPLDISMEVGEVNGSWTTLKEIKL